MPVSPLPAFPSEAATLTLKARITIPGAKAITVAGRAVPAAAGKPLKLTLKLSKKTRARIKRA